MRTDREDRSILCSLRCQSDVRRLERLSRNSHPEWVSRSQSRPVQDVQLSHRPEKLFGEPLADFVSGLWAGKRVGTFLRAAKSDIGQQSCDWMFGCSCSP